MAVTDGSDDALYREKHRQVAETLKETGVDCWLVWVRETSQMADPVLPLLLEADLVWPSALLFTAAGERIALVGSFDAMGIPEGRFDRVVPYVEGISTPLRDELARIDPATLAVNESPNDVAADGLTAGMKLLLQQILEGTPYGDRLGRAEEIVRRLRGRKTPTELLRIDIAVRITEEILQTLWPTVRAGQTEIEIQQAVHEAMRARGVTPSWNPRTNPAVDAGPGKPFGHGAPTDRRTRTGQLLHFDVGVRYRGYCSDLQRMAFFGARDELPDEVAHAFDTVREAIQASAAALAPGARGTDIDAVARSLVVDRGYPAYQHALGHQIGRQAHDGGTLLGPCWERYGNAPLGTVEPGNAFTLELGVPTVNYGAVSLEEDVVVTEDGCRFLSRPQEALICLGR
jgi:Xaa-Pro aminopeptidase